MYTDFVEEQVSINGEVNIKGTLAIPHIENKKLPAILIVNGSNSVDRNGNIKIPKIKVNIYKELAHLGARLGFVTLRYDKRGVGESGGDKYSKGVTELVDDIISNIKFLKNHPKVDKDKIILLGHSEGCILSTIASAMIPVKGLILVAGAGVCLKSLIKYVDIKMLEEAKKKRGLKGRILRLFINEDSMKKQLDCLNKEIDNCNNNAIRFRFKRMSGKWFKEHYKYRDEDILRILENSNCNILAITGTKDVQADPNHLKGIEKLNKDNIKCVAIENMDHMLKECTDKKTVLGLINQYQEESCKSLHSKFKAILEEWLNTFFHH
jgi:uncharacterized protein